MHVLWDFDSLADCQRSICGLWSVQWVVGNEHKNALERISSKGGSTKELP